LSFGRHIVFVTRTLTALALTIALAACRLERAPSGRPGGGYAVEPDSVTNAEVYATLRGYYAALTARNWRQLGGYFLSHGTITDLRRVPGEADPRPRTIGIEEFVARAGRPHVFSFADEPLHANIVTYGPLADAWVTYRARIGVTRDSVVTRFGIDAFHLLKVGGRWRIAGLAFQNEVPGLPIAPAGPAVAAVPAVPPPARR
jgi:hypothetical protein